MLKTPLSKLLRIIADVLDSLDEKELDALAVGKGKLVFVANEATTEKVKLADTNVESVVKRLYTCRDREEARKVLSEIVGKDALTAVAKSQRIHVAKHDRREDIESKVIEFVIGGRLRSEAIQTLNLKGASTGGNGSHEPT